MAILLLLKATQMNKLFQLQFFVGCRVYFNILYLDFYITYFKNLFHKGFFSSPALVETEVRTNCEEGCVPGRPSSQGAHRANCRLPHLHAGPRAALYPSRGEPIWTPAVQYFPPPSAVYWARQQPGVSYRSNRRRVSLTLCMAIRPSPFPRGKDAA